MVSPQSSAQPPRSTPKGGLRAVVIGGGVAGLAACSAIAPHVHALLDSGRQALEQLMPGLGAALQSAGSLPQGREDLLDASVQSLSLIHI